MKFTPLEFDEHEEQFYEEDDLDIVKQEECDRQKILDALEDEFIDFD